MKEANSKIKFFSPFAIISIIIVIAGVVFLILRFIKGLGPVTNLSHYYPWGIWIALNVESGVALSAGGFVTGALVMVFGRKKYRELLRPALLTALLGYTFAAIGVIIDLGRYYNFWHILVFWQGNSVLFEVGMCIMTYLIILGLEFSPVLLEELEERKVLTGAGRRIGGFIEKFLPLLVIFGVVVSCLHQSSLGGLMVIAGTKTHPLWFTPLLPLLFLFSAIAAGFPVVIIESILVSKWLKRKINVEMLSPLSKFILFLLLCYAVMKFSDITIRNVFNYVLKWDVFSLYFIFEIMIGIIIPAIIFFILIWKKSINLLLAGSFFIVIGIIINRFNVFLVAYSPPYSIRRYFPSIEEIIIALAFIFAPILLHRFAILSLPVVKEKFEKLLISEKIVAE